MELLPSHAAVPAGSEPGEGIRAVLFDAGDVLYHRPDRRERLQRFLLDAGIDPRPDQPEAEDLLMEQAYRGEIDQAGYREGVLRLHGIQQPELLEQGKRLLEQQDDSVEFFEGVQPTLSALKGKGYMLGIVTDTANPVYRKLRWFERGGFGHVWDSIISSNELGVRKPDPRIYHAALEQLGLTPAQAVFVGHKASELEGAQAVGMTTVAFNPDPDARAEQCIEKFSDLLRLPLLA
jgi:HAD superfamily hydrolase (TIGR01509 family)